tara:strand:+ start:2080 stop:3030 length:951 start_codon:yes stop_codon:yes gene_type:complete
MKTLTEQYRLIKEDKGHKGVFLKEAKRKFPNLIKNNSTFKEASTILKQKGVISENFVGTPMIGNPLERKKEGYENAFEKFLQEAEAKAEEKKVSKEVEEDYEKNYDLEDKKDPNNMIFGQIQMGYYFEMKQEKNADKTIEEIKDIVFKNLAKDPIYYTKEGQFGEEVGYTDEAPSLGEPKEPKGPHKSSGYGKVEGESKFKYVVNESKKPVNEIAVAGGLVTGGGFSHMNYMDYFGLNEDETNEATEQEVENQKELNAELEKTAKLQKDMMEEDMDAPMHIEALADAAEAAYDAGMSIDEIMSMIEQHLGLKMGDF